MEAPGRVAQDPTNAARGPAVSAARGDAAPGAVSGRAPRVAGGVMMIITIIMISLTSIRMLMIMTIIMMILNNANHNHSHNNYDKAGPARKTRPTRRGRSTSPGATGGPRRTPSAAQRRGSRRTWTRSLWPTSPNAGTSFRTPGPSRIGIVKDVHTSEELHLNLYFHIISKIYGCVK